MKKLMLVLLLSICCQYCWASEIRSYTLNQMEITREEGGVKIVPILEMDTKKPLTMKLIIAGLGTNRVTAQCSVLSLAIEHQIYPMDKPDNGTGDDGAQWFYVRFNLGVTIIKIKGDNIALYNLGDAPYTYLGTRDRLGPTESTESKSN